MSLCPPKGSDEWKSLVEAVGEFEATRDWMENDFTTRDPSLVQDKLMQLQDISQSFRMGEFEDTFKEGPVPPSFDDAFQQNYKGPKTVHKIKYDKGIMKDMISAKQFIKISGLRKENNKFIIDKSLYPNAGLTSDLSITSKFWKGKDLFIVDKRVFVKAGDNQAFREFYPFLDYKNPIKIKSRTYYFLTNKFIYDTSENIENKKQFDIRYAIAAKAGRYGIKPSKRVNLSPRLKNTFQEYIKSYEQSQEGVPEAITESTKEFDKYLDNLVTDPATYSDSELRKQAIDNLLTQVDLHNPNQHQQFKDIFNKLPTVVLANMNLNFYNPEVQEGYGMGDRIVSLNPYEMRNLNEFGDRVGTMEPTPLKITLGTNALISDNTEYKFAIDKVNNQIFNNTFKDSLTGDEEATLQSYGISRGIQYGNRTKGESTGVTKVKSKGVAVLLELHKKDRKLARKFSVEYKDNLKGRTSVIKSKLEKDFGIDKLRELQNKQEAVNSLKNLYQSILGYQIYDKAFTANINSNPAEFLNDDVYNMIGSTAHFVYDMSAHNPLLNETNKLIDEVWRGWANEIGIGNQLSPKEKFAHIYNAVITGKGQVANQLKKTTLAQRILDLVGGLITWILGRNVRTTAFDVLEQKINQLHESIAAAHTLDTYNYGHYEFNSLRTEIKSLFQEVKYGQGFYQANHSSIAVMINDLVPIHIINKVIRNGYYNDLELGGFGKLPEGLDLSRYSIIHFDSLTEFPQDIKLPTSGATLYLSQFNRADIPVHIMNQIRENDLRTKDWIAPKETGTEVISKTKSQILTGVKSKYGFEHEATYYDKKTQAFHYELGVQGKPVTVEFNAGTDQFPDQYYKSFNWHHVKGERPIGWFGGVISDTQLSDDKQRYEKKKVFTVTEVQSDPLQRTGKLKTGTDLGTNVSPFAGLRSQIENHFKGWYYVFAGTGIYTVLKNNPDITEIRVPTSAYYATLHPSAPVEIYDKIGSMFKHTLEGSVKVTASTKQMTEDELIAFNENPESNLEPKWQVIKVSDIAGMTPENMMDQYDVIIRAGISAGVKDQKELTPDLASDWELARDTLNAMLEHDIFKKYFNSDTGKKHLELLKKWIDGYFSEEKPESGTAEGGEGILVDPEGNEISEEDADPLQELIQGSLTRETRIDIDWALDELSKAMAAKNQVRVNFIKQLLDENQGKSGIVSYNRVSIQDPVLQSILRSYGISDQGFLKSGINPAKLQIDLNKAGYNYKVTKTKTGGYYVADQYGRPVYFREVSIPDTQTQKNLIAGDTLNKLISWLETKFPNLRVLRLTPEEAKLITQETANPWNGEPVFFYQGNVYIVGENVTANMILHEFAHPIFRSMWKSENKTTVNLFHKMYDDLAATDEGIRIIAEVTANYPELVPGTEYFKEEILVRALAQRADDLRNEIKSSPGFLGVINRILYTIKQFLRKLFTQPISPENLDVNTTIDQLADMLINKDFKIDRSLISQEDMVAFYKEHNKLADELFGAKLETKIQPILQQLYNTSLREKVRALENENLPEMLRLVQNEFGLNQLSEIRKSIYKYKDEITSKIKDDIERDDILDKQARSFISSLYNLETITKNLSQEMDKIKSTDRTKEDVLRVQSIIEFIKYWENFLVGNSGAKQQLLNSGLNTNSDLVKLIDTVVNNIVKTKLHADPILKEGIEILLTDILKTQSDRIDKMYKEHMDKLIDKNASKELIKSYQQEYEKLRMSPGKIKAMLSGMGDAGVLNNMLEGWLYSSDEVVGGMGVFFKNIHNLIQTEVQAKFTDFVSSIVPLAKAAGLTLGTDVSQFSKRFLFVDSKPVWEDGKLIKQEVFTFINKHKDYRWEVADLNNKLRETEEKFEKTGDPADEVILNSLIVDKEDLDKYFWREYTDDFYEKDTMFKSPVGIKAKKQRDDLYQQINELSRSAEKEGDLLDIRPGDSLSPAAQIDMLRKQLRQLYSLKDLNDEYKTGEDKEIAEILQHSREVNKSYYKYREIPGMFQKLLSRYEQELIESGLDPQSNEFLDKRQQWLDNNTVQAVLPEFYQRTSEIYTQIKEIYNTVLNPSKISLELADTYKEITDTLSGYRDDDGQPVGSDMSPKTILKIKTLQEKVDKLRKELGRGLSEDEQNELETLLSYTKKRGGEGIDQDEAARIGELIAKADQSGLTKWQRADLSRLWQDLAQLQSKEPTEYYLDIFNNFMEKLPEEVKEQIMSLNKVASIDKSTADYVINLPIETLKDMLNSVPGFKDWFKANHILKTIWDPSIKKERRVYQRVSAWSVTRPIDPSYIVRTSVEAVDGSKTTIEGKPSPRFYERIVRPEFETPEVVGETVDVFGNFLPRSQAEGAPSDKFVNPEYERLRREEPDLFKVLEAIKKQYLTFQEGTDKYARLGYDFPMFRKRTSETIASGGNPASTWWENLKAFFQKRQDDPDSGYNLQNEIDLTNEPYFDTTEDPKMPVPGVYNLPKEDVSLDLFHGVAQYMAGLERQKQLKQILPFFQATHDVLSDPANATKTVAGLEKRLLGRGKNVRTAALKNKIDREFFGQTNTGIFANNKGINGIVNAMFRGASISYLAWQIPSAIANMTVQIVQNVIRSASGEQFTIAELTRGSVWAGKASTVISSEIYRDSTHSLIVQLCEIFDPIPGRYLQSELGRSQGRSWLRDFASLSWLYSPRKFMENYATLQAFGAMMDHVRVKQITPEDTREINYLDAWELKDNKITLKPGIDQSYAQGGAKFNEILNYMQHVQHDMNGAYDNFSQPEAARYILYRMYSFLRRYVTTMLTNRFAPTRLSPGMMEQRTGFYTSVAKTLWRALTMDPKVLLNMSPPERAAARQFLTEIGLVALMWFMYGLFDWDPDDDERYAKLRAKSGPLPLPFVPETENPFQADGWLSNHGLLQLLKLKSQTEMWIPIPGLGLKDYTSLPSITPIAIGPTIDLVAKIFDTSIKLASGDQRAYYQRTVGPYNWQQEDSPKLYNYIGQFAGMRGATVTPELAIEKQEQAKVLK